MKITIPFRMFSNLYGEVELKFNPHINMNAVREDIEEKGRQDARILAQYLGSFKDEFQRVLVGYERVPGIGILFWEIKKFSEDEELNNRLMELLKEDHAERMGYDGDDDS